MKESTEENLVTLKQVLEGIPKYAFLRGPFRQRIKEEFRSAPVKTTCAAIATSATILGLLSMVSERLIKPNPWAQFTFSCVLSVSIMYLAMTANKVTTPLRLALRIILIGTAGGMTMMGVCLLISDPTYSFPKLLSRIATISGGIFALTRVLVDVVDEIYILNTKIEALEIRLLNTSQSPPESSPPESR